MSDDILVLAQLLSCPARLAALRAVADGGLGVTEIARVTGVAVSTASFHLGKLLDAGLVHFQRRGRRRIYRLGRWRFYLAVEDGRS
jgi:DNA-binding transcriptional ArsR family regulator